WLANYITANDGAGEDVKARYPLREARVRVRELPDRPGSYLCVFHLRPHYQLDQMNAAVRLVTTLSPGQPGSGVRGQHRAAAGGTSDLWRGANHERARTFPGREPAGGDHGGPGRGQAQPHGRAPAGLPL